MTAIRLVGQDPNTGKAILNYATIDEDGRVFTVAVAKDARLDACERGNAFIIHTSFETITNTAAFSGLCYIKNTASNKHIHVSNVRVCSTGSGYVQARLYKNPTTGTLIGSGTNVTVINTNFESNTQFEGTALKGADSLTITDGDMMENWTQAAPGNDNQDFQGAIILGPGDSIALEVRPSATGDICTAWQVYVEGAGVL